jgi:hypothetical protein
VTAVVFIRTLYSFSFLFQEGDRLLVTEFFRRRNMSMHYTRMRLGFLYSSYKEEFWWFEIEELFRKLLMGSLMVLTCTVLLCVPLI